MIEETGKVIRIAERDKDIAVILVNRKEACSGCSAKNFCHPFSEEENSLEITAINEVNAKVGDTVIVAIPEKQFLKASFIVYLIPVIALLAGSFVGEILFKNDIATFVTASLFFIVSFFIISKYSEKRNIDYLPSILEIKY